MRADEANRTSRLRQLARSAEASFPIHYWLPQSGWQSRRRWRSQSTGPEREGSNPRFGSPERAGHRAPPAVLERYPERFPGRFPERLLDIALVSRLYQHSGDTVATGCATTLPLG